MHVLFGQLGETVSDHPSTELVVEKFSVDRPMEFHIHATRPSVVDLPRGCTDNIFEYIYAIANIK